MRKGLGIGVASCINCHTTKTPMWRRSLSCDLLCNACGLYYKTHGSHRPLGLNKESGNSTVAKRAVTKKPSPSHRTLPLNTLKAQKQLSVSSSDSFTPPDGLRSCDTHVHMGQLICLGDCVDVRASDGFLYKGVLERIIVPYADSDVSAVCQVTWLIPNAPAPGSGPTSATLHPLTCVEGLVYQNAIAHFRHEPDFAAYDIKEERSLWDRRNEVSRSPKLSRYLRCSDDVKEAAALLCGMAAMC